MYTYILYYIANFHHDSAHIQFFAQVIHHQGSKSQKQSFWNEIIFFLHYCCWALLCRRNVISSDLTLIKLSSLCSGVKNWSSAPSYFLRSSTICATQVIHYHRDLYSIEKNAVNRGPHTAVYPDYNNRYVTLINGFLCFISRLPKCK